MAQTKAAGSALRDGSVAEFSVQRSVSVAHVGLVTHLGEGPTHLWKRNAVARVAGPDLSACKFIGKPVRGG